MNSMEYLDGNLSKKNDQSNFMDMSMNESGEGGTTKLAPGASLNLHLPNIKSPKN